MNNPYQTPKTEFQANDANSNKVDASLASRWKRLFAALIDAFIGLLIGIPFWLLFDIWDYMLSSQQPSFYIAMLAGIYGFIGFVVVHYYFINKNGQTVGKMLLGIRMVDLEGGLKSAPNIILKRYLPITLASIIPAIGSLLVFVDVLFIFRKDKRCIHDLIAGTKVVNA